MNTLGIAIISAGRKSGLKRCLASVLPRSLPVFVVVNGRDTVTEKFLADSEKEHPLLRYTVLEQPAAKSRARNIAVSSLTTDIVYFIDDDACLAPYSDLEKVAAEFRKLPELGAVGGPNLTPQESTLFQRLSGQILSSPFGAYTMHCRYKQDREQFCDDRYLVLCNLAVRRDVFIEGQLQFDERLHYNEENLLLQQMLHRGMKLRYLPWLAVYHERRKTLLQFARQVYESGKGRAGMTVLMPDSIALPYVIPSFFVLYLAAFPVFSLPVYRLLFWIYLGVDLMNALYIVVARREPLWTLPFLCGVALVAHISYGAGFLKGMLENLLWIKKA